MQTVLEKKVSLINTLSADSSCILQYVQQEKIITRRDYNNLNHTNYTQEKIVTNLLDMVMNKGDKMCREFVDLLQRSDLQENYPDLKELFIPTPAPAPAPAPHDQGQTPNEIIEYKMSSVPRGLCVIINNVNFDPPLKTRNGSNADEESLRKVFEWLGFKMHVHKNQTAEQMRNLLKGYSQTTHDGDCFVCCILSHGSNDGVHGTDGNIVSRDDIFCPFSGNSCPSLINKPKVFFIQACRGNEYHLPVEIQSDSYEEADVQMEDEASLQVDVVQMSTLPADADFLIARSTVKGYLSFRETVSGSWFIQSLCKQLETYCPKGEDISAILLCVNKEVSEKAARLRIVSIAKQMPVHKVTLRKKLVFHVPK